MQPRPITVDYISHMGDDLAIVNGARVSYDKRKDTFDESDARLIRYLARHGHWSPFAHTAISLRIEAPIFVARQLVKHQVGLTWNEVSRRYVDSEPAFWLPDVLHERPEHSKQGAGGKHARSDELLPAIRMTARSALDEYRYLIGMGVAPEEARMVLPLNTMTTWIWTGSLMAFARVCRQRLGPDAQQAAREVAQGIAAVVQPLYPHAWGALMEDTHGSD